MAFVNDTNGDRSYDSDRGAALIYKECDRDRLETLELHWKEKK